MAAAGRSRAEAGARAHLERLDGQKQLELDRLRAELGDCRAALEAGRLKEQALAARKRLLEKEVRAHAAPLVLHPVTFNTVLTLSRCPSCRAHRPLRSTASR